VEGVASAMLLASATIADAAARILVSFIFSLLFIVDFELCSYESSVDLIAARSVE
jgi:hypothetical protein